MKTLDMEILAPGKWNGVNISMDHMQQIVTNFSKLKDKVQVYLKLGHNKEQKVTDGQPALGWAEKLWVNDAGKLMARFMEIPDVVYEAISKKLYRNVSIEALLDVKHKGENYGTILTAVALLGADMPAVNTLEDLKTYMSADFNLEGSVVNFSAISGSINSEDTDMAKEAELQAEIDRLKAEATAKDEQIKLAAKKAAEAESQVVTLTAKVDSIEENQKKVEFTRRETAVKKDLEDLVKAKVITPAKRDELTKDITQDTIGTLELKVETYKEMEPAKGKEEEEQMRKGAGKEEFDHPDDALFAAAKAIQAKSPDITFKAAVKLAMENDPELGREYINYNDVA